MSVEKLMLAKTLWLFFMPSQEDMERIVSHLPNNIAAELPPELLGEIFHDALSGLEYLLAEHMDLDEL